MMVLSDNCVAGRAMERYAASQAACWWPGPAAGPIGAA
jgi:hypothetical protein